MVNHLNSFYGVQNSCPLDTIDNIALQNLLSIVSNGQQCNAFLHKVVSNVHN